MIVLSFWASQQRSDGQYVLVLDRTAGQGHACTGRDCRRSSAGLFSEHDSDRGLGSQAVHPAAADAADVPFCGFLQAALKMF